MRNAKLVGAFLVMLVATALTLTQARAADPKPDADGFTSLFDGKTLDGWDGDPKFWSVQDGCITGVAGKDKADQPKTNTFLIWKGGEPGDFELRAAWKLEAHNSGIQYRSKKQPDAGENKWIVGGYQADMDGTNRYTGICYEEKGRGILVNRGEKLTIAQDGKKTVESKGDDKAIVAAIKKGDWNEYVITCKGNHVVQKINGVTTADITDNDPKKGASKGVIALQMHQGPPMKVQFKDLKLKKLD